MSWFKILFTLFFIFIFSIILFGLSASAFLVKAPSASLSCYDASTDFFVLHSGLKQLPGESSTEFIKRVTSEANKLKSQAKQTSASRDTENGKKKSGKYQRIEEWDAERKEKGELSWENKVQFDGQRFGNKVNQDSILRRHLGTFFLMKIAISTNRCKLAHLMFCNAKKEHDTATM